MSVRISGSTIPYQLRGRKAIERNIFIDLLKKLRSYSSIKFEDYKYIGFGAAFLEEFKMMHIELGIEKMHSIEFDKYAKTRQDFNKPYNFIKGFPVPSGTYINEEFDGEDPVVFWLDYTRIKDIPNQLLEIQELSKKLVSGDILKITFNSDFKNFCEVHGIDEGEEITDSFKNAVSFFKSHSVFKDFFNPSIIALDFKNFDEILRNMAIRAINRGLQKIGSTLKFMHLTAFSYADGQLMTTMTGIFINDEKEYAEIETQTGLTTWPFYLATTLDLIEAHRIDIPNMTAAERLAIDKYLIEKNVDEIIAVLPFKYGNASEHKKSIEFYYKFYKYLPYFGKVTY